jgi:branched-subunit amino acid transport protein
MEIRPEILIIVIGSALVTAGPRVIPLVLLSRISLPAWLREWLGAVPIAILAALLATELLTSGGRLVPLAGNLALLAIFPVLGIAYRTRSLLGAVAAGVLTIALLRNFAP